MYGNTTFWETECDWEKTDHLGYSQDRDWTVSSNAVLITKPCFNGLFYIHIN